MDDGSLERQSKATGRVINLAEVSLYTAQAGAQTFRATIGPATIGSDAVSGGWYRVAAGAANHLDMHPDKDEFYFIHRGSATIMFDGQPVRMTAGDTVFVPHGVEHWIINDPDQDLELFFFFAAAAPPFPIREAARYPVVEFEPA